MESGTNWPLLYSHFQVHFQTTTWVSDDPINLHMFASPDRNILKDILWWGIDFASPIRGKALERLHNASFARKSLKKNSWRKKRSRSRMSHRYYSFEQTSSLEVCGSPHVTVPLIKVKPVFTTRSMILQKIWQCHDIELVYGTNYQRPTAILSTYACVLGSL